jgi:hypothetical protein
MSQTPDRRPAAWDASRIDPPQDAIDRDHADPRLPPTPIVTMTDAERHEFARLVVD